MPLMNYPSQKRTTVSISPHIAGGFTTPDELRQIAYIAEKYGGKLKIVGSSISIMNITPADAQSASAELGSTNASFTVKSVRPITICPGKPSCPRGQQDSTTLGLALDKEFFGYPTPGKVRIGVSGCPNCCAEVFVKDIGLFGLPKGYTIVVGGNSGRQAKIGQEVAHNVPPGQVPVIISNILSYYCQQGHQGERIGQLISRIGTETFLAETIPAQYRIK